ncbi:hypothetical protein KHM83_19120 [Fusibacter paucivorans]|uniref:PH domain-containing protein n=1 Tax=Fusibacter paucivorans TaxID=76009 RepID=A0ABS5PWN8_9FIRM|nr:hypothetical protein [Fusibacter paucivorans]MBS7528782.1 hypothetical protein [Fusibacter paucivorans]
MKFTTIRKWITFTGLYLIILFIINREINSAYISMILIVSAMYLWNYAITIDHHYLVVHRLVNKNIKVNLSEIEAVEIESNHLGYGSWTLMTIKSRYKQYEFKMTHFNQKALVKAIELLSVQYDFELDQSKFRTSKMDFI